ncbi:hypothetical protein AX17_002498 [Amanita inopinata Kibby_2008]|nr:hypothetical protein AX17_002498 [Amanita inopinata Kibby_2008]
MLSGLQTWVVTFAVLFGAGAACVSASLVDDIIHALENAVDCASCHALLAPLQLVALLGDAAFSKTIIAICKTFKLIDDDICEGIVSQQGLIVAHDLRLISTKGQTATKLCDFMLGLCQPPAVNQYMVPFPKPAPKNPKTFVSTGRKPFQVAHFSDVHIDRQYTVGADASCEKPICCRNYTDHAGPVVTPAGPFGSRHCDTPASLVHSMLHAIPKKSAFSIFTGDVVEAAVWLVNENEVTNDLQMFNQEMSNILGAPVFPAIGNHEAAPVNSFPRNTTKSVSSEWVFYTQSEGWAAWLDSGAIDQVIHMSGSYAVTAPGTNLRIISLNTIYWYKDNLWLYDSDTPQPDPNGILEFAVRELQAAEDAGQRAWIIGHMPPSRADTLHDQSNYFDQVVQRYHNTIAGQFYGHSHEDQFAIAYSDYAHRTADTAVSVGWIAPSVTPRDGNSAFKVYDVDPDTYEIMDARVFMSDLADTTFQTNPAWKPYYGARDTYGPLVGLGPNESLSPAFWHKVTEVFATNDTAFQMYQTFRSRGVNVPSCDSTCKAKVICELRALRAEDNCDISTPGFNFKRSLSDAHADHCEGINIGHILSNIPGEMSDEQRAALRRVLERDILQG